MAWRQLSSLTEKQRAGKPEVLRGGEERSHFALRVCWWNGGSISLFQPRSLNHPQPRLPGKFWAAPSLLPTKAGIMDGAMVTAQISRGDRREAVRAGCLF